MSNAASQSCRQHDRYAIRSALLDDSERQVMKSRGYSTSLQVSKTKTARIFRSYTASELLPLRTISSRQVGFDRLASERSDQRPSLAIAASSTFRCSAAMGSSWAAGSPATQVAQSTLALAATSSFTRRSK